MVVVFSIVFFISLVVIYLVFAFTTPIPAGKNLTRSDWLVFVSGVLALLGSVIVSIISITQAAFFNELNEKHYDSERIEVIKPSLVVTIKGENVRIPYIDRNPSERLHFEMFGCELLDIYKKSTKNSIEDGIGRILQLLDTENKQDDINNIWISITNVGQYPINHILLYGEHYFPYIRAGNSLDVILTLDKYPKIKSLLGENAGIELINNSISKIKVIDVTKERKSPGDYVEFPKQYDYIWMDFEDMDGNGYHQEFELMELENGKWYSGNKMSLETINKLDSKAVPLS